MEADVKIYILSLNTATYEFKLITLIGGTGRPRADDCDVLASHTTYAAFILATHVT